MTTDDWPFPWPADGIARYTAHRAATPPTIDGRLDEPAWQHAPRSPRFRDLVSGGPVRYDTQAAILWDDTNLYAGFWVEEPNVSATLTERDSLIYTDNDVELFVAGDDGYYELEVNAFGTIYEVFFLWDAAGRTLHGEATPFPGVGYPEHPRGSRHGYFAWDYPGLEIGVHVDGTLNDDGDVDRGWTVELALPWDGMRGTPLADGRAVPPNPGDVWRISCSRFNTERGDANDSTGWAWSPHGVWDSHIPELFPHVEFSGQPFG